MAITFIGQAGAGGTGTAMSVTHGLTIEAGDVLVCCIAFDRPTALTVADNNGANSFTEDLDEQAGGSYTIGGYVGHRVAGGSEPSSYAWTLSASDGYSLMLLQFRGVDNSTVWDVAPGTPAWNTQNSTSAVADAVTAAVAGTEGIFFGVMDSSSGTFSSINNSYLNENEPLGNLRGATYRRNFASSGTTGATTATLATSKKNANIQFLLNPAAAGDALLADDIESASEAATVAIGQKHVLLANDTESASEAATVAIGQEHTLLADDVESASETLTVAGNQIVGALADDIESASETETVAIGQEHALLADDIESASEAATVAVGQEHALLADDVDSASEVTTPTLSSSANEDALLAEDVESASEVTASAIGQEHALLADDIECSSETLTVAGNQIVGALADDVESASEITTPAFVQIVDCLADDIESASETATVAIGQEHGLLADDVESTSEVTAPNIGGEGDLFADDITSTSEVTVGTVGQVHVLLAASIESTSALTTPTIDRITAEGATFIGALSGNLVKDLVRQATL